MYLKFLFQKYNKIHDFRQASKNYDKYFWILNFFLDKE